MNKKFLSTLLTVVAASVTLNAAPVAKARAKVVEVEMAPAKLLEVKISPQRLIGEGTIGLAIESGFSNFAGDLHGEWLYSRNSNLSITPAYFLTFSGLNVGLNLTYYAKENRRSGLYWSFGANLTMGYDIDKTKAKVDDYYPSKEKGVSALSAHFTMGHKIEILDFLYASNSIELPYLVWSKDASNETLKGQDASDAFKTANIFGILSKARLNLLEVRFAF